MTIAAPSAQAGDAWMAVTVLLMKLSPMVMSIASTSQPGIPTAMALAVVMPCMSLHWFGLIQTKFGILAAVFIMSVAKVVNGTILFMRFAFVRMSWKYMNGSCFWA